MRSFLLGVGATVCVSVFASFVMSPAVPVRIVSPLRIQDLTLDRLVRVPISLTPAGANTYHGAVQLPAAFGFVLDSIQTPNGLVAVTTNGNAAGSFGTTGAPTIKDQPLVLHPSDSVGFSTYTIATPATLDIVLIGWIVYPGEV